MQPYRDHEDIPPQYLNRHGRRSAVAIARKRPYLARVARAKDHIEREVMKRAAGLKARIARHQARKSAAGAFMSTLKSVKI